jgi:hypothetical protein
VGVLASKNTPIRDNPSLTLLLEKKTLLYLLNAGNKLDFQMGASTKRQGQDILHTRTRGDEAWMDVIIGEVLSQDAT